MPRLKKENRKQRPFLGIETIVDMTPNISQALQTEARGAQFCPTEDMATTRVRRILDVLGEYEDGYIYCLQLHHWSKNQACQIQWDEALVDRAK